MAQTLDLSFRDAPSGGDVDIDGAWSRAAALRGREHLVLLVHGYNDDAAYASEAYEAFCNGQQALAGPGSDWAPGATIVRVFWPGDASWGAASSLFYPMAVGRALDVGYALGQILADLAGYVTALTVDCVAHSLGNRVLLHAIGQLGSNQKVWIRRVVHMAGAVPIWTFDPKAQREQLRSSLVQEVSNGSRATSLFSEYDDVLATAFPIGESAASTYDGEDPVVALGHAFWGDTDALPDLSQQRATGAGHSDYWGCEKSTAPALRNWVYETARAALDLPSAAPRSIPARPTVSRPVANGRALGSRAVGDS